MVGNFPAVLNFNRLFLKLNRFICNQLPVLPDHSWASAGLALYMSGATPAEAGLVLQERHLLYTQQIFLMLKCVNTAE